MKSTAIQGAANLFAAASRAQGKSAAKAPEVDFSVVIGQANFQNQETLQDSGRKRTEKTSDLQKVSESTKTDGSEKAEKSFEAAEKPETPEKPEKPETPMEKQKAADGGESSLQELPEETVFQVADFLSKVREVFQSGFSMTEEELLSALEQLGFTMADLMNPDTWNACIQALSGAQDSMALLVDEQLYTTCTQIQKELSALLESFEEEVPLTPEEMDLVLSKLEEMQEAGQIHEAQSALPEETAEFRELTAAAEPETAEAIEVRVPEKSAEPAAQERTAVAAVERNQAEPKLQRTEESVEKQKTEPEKPAVENLQKNQRESGLLQQNLSENANQNQPGMQFAEPAAQNVWEPELSVPSFTTYDGSYESIIRQVAEQIRVQVTADTSAVEMQLNPESLGRLTLSVELKQGMLTAKFIAENEQVKEAIENQAVVLREDLDRQGLKVEAIEVTVETHEFERNLEQGQQQNQAEEEMRNEQSRRSSRRNLNLDILEEEEELTEAEDLAAKIMRENGNTMDYFA